jgi:hypothetical protein
MEVCVWVQTKSPCYVSHTVIHCWVFGHHRAQLQGDLVLGYFHCHGNSALQGGVAVSVPIIIDSFYSLWTLPCGLMGTIPQGTTDCVGESRQHRWWSRSERASPGQVLTAAAALGTGHLGTRRIIPVSHPLPKDPCVNLGSPTMGGSHQTQEKT